MIVFTVLGMIVLEYLVEGVTPLSCSAHVLPVATQ